MTTQYLRTILIHIPIGLGIVAALLVHWIVSFSILLGFLTYEIVELVVLLFDRWQNKQQVCDVLNRAYPEIAGMLIGIGTGALTIWILNYFGIDLHFVFR